ncbi:hypothetical protein ScalyP_jg9363 [Parmales sp. scaly parma]|nr:hypothetical protein ScalyP_jg9363 [Parmales sp. scaly parma]
MGRKSKKVKLNDGTNNDNSSDEENPAAPPSNSTISLKNALMRSSNSAPIPMEHDDDVDTLQTTVANADGSSTTTKTNTTGFIYKSDDDALDYCGSDDDSSVEVMIADSSAGLLQANNVGRQKFVNLVYSREVDGAVDLTDGAAVGDWTAEPEMEEVEEVDAATKAARAATRLEMLKEKKRLGDCLRESEENAGRDPCMFSKRTAFDIGIHLIEEKPWLERGLEEYMNYNMEEADWEEYSAKQNEIRQELINADRGKRKPDPVIVRVTPRQPKVEVKVTLGVEGVGEEVGDFFVEGETIGPAVAPVEFAKKKKKKKKNLLSNIEKMTDGESSSEEDEDEDEGKVIGAWKLPKKGSKLELLLAKQAANAPPIPSPQRATISRPGRFSRPRWASRPAPVPG